MKTDARVIHFTGTSKPWSYYDSHPFRSDYYKYLRRTPWRGYRPDGRPVASVRARSMVARLTPDFVKGAYRKLAGAGAARGIPPSVKES